MTFSILDLKINAKITHIKTGVMLRTLFFLNAIAKRIAKVIMNARTGWPEDKTFGSAFDISPFKNAKSRYINKETLVVMEKCQIPKAKPMHAKKPRKTGLCAQKNGIIPKSNPNPIAFLKLTFSAIGRKTKA